MRYRRSVYRKRKIKIIVITSLCVLAALALIFVIVGNMLGKKVEQSVNDRAPTKQSTTDIPHATVKDVNAYPIALWVEGSSQLSSRVSSAVKNGYSDICFDICDDSGNLFYISKAAQSLGKQSSNTTGLNSLDNIVKTFSGTGVYSIAVIEANDLKSDDDLIRSAARGYYSAIAAELLRAGINEVLISVGELPSERYTELITLAEEIHRLSPDKGHVGISLPVGLLSSVENETLVASIWGAFDYIAVDLYSNVSLDENTVANIESKLGSMLYSLLRYNVRALLPRTDNQELTAAMRDMAISEGVKSIQIMP
jgi:hypothetical protein